VQGPQADARGQAGQLDDLSQQCNARAEPSLAALVVNQNTGQPGAGWRDGGMEASLGR